MTSFAEMADILTPWVIRVAATLRIADHINDGVTHVEELASRTDTDRDALARMLRYLAVRGVFAEPEPGVFTLTEQARPLLSGEPGSRRARLDQNGFGGRLEFAFSKLLHSVRTGEPAYAAVHGRPLWDDIQANPDITPSFDQIMAQHAAAFDQVVDDFDWSGVGHVADIGGSSGELLGKVLAANPGLSGTLLDTSAAVRNAPKVLADAGVEDRCTVIAGTFFDPLPTGADVYVLSNVLHDWPDTDAERIMRRCADACGAEGTVLIFDRINGAQADPTWVTHMDLRMLTAIGGRERTEDDFAALAAKVGLKIAAVRPGRNGLGLLECVPATGASR